MKKSSVLFAVMLLFATGSFACDICGCGVGGYYIGILPDFHKHIFGFRYRFNDIKTHIGAGGANTYLTSGEKYQTLELWGGWNIGKKFRIMASVPYAFNQRSNQGITSSKNGLGDVVVNGYYRLLDSRHAVFSDKLLVQTLWIGAGIKLPTGQYTSTDKQNTNQNTNLFQLGTASTDFSLNVMYDLRIQDMGINVAASYKVNTANKYNYNYGNKLSSTALIYHKFRMNKLTIAPNTGMVWEQSKRDIDNRILVDVSGGRLLLGSIGAEASLNGISIGANWQAPLSQKLANGFVKANNRLMLHISFLL